MKCCLYARISTEAQNLQVQFDELRREAFRRKFEVVGEFSDISSGGSDARSGLEKMMATVRRGEVEVVMIVRIDRLVRSLRQYANLIEELGKRAVGLVVTRQGIDTSASNPMARLTMNVLASVAEFERDLIRERTVAGIEAARARGSRIGRPSPRLAGIDREAVMAKWERDGQPGGYRGLGERLGGVGKMTAWRLWKARKPAALVEEIA